MATANDIIKKAISQIGVAEKPSGSNNVIYNTWYYGRAVCGAAYPWCCAFVNWVFNECGASDLFYGGQKTAYCPTVESYYRKQGRWFKSGNVGDLVLFDFSGKGIAGHIGIVEKVNADGTYTTIEGNTSTSNQANGGCVMRRTRSISTIRGFARPNYGGSTATTKNTVTVTKTGGKTVNITLNQLQKGDTGKQVMTLQRLLQGFGFDIGKDGVDGDFGNNTMKALKAFQKGNGLTVDGICGTNSWTKLLK